MSEPENPAPPVRVRSRLAKFADWALILLLVALGVSQVVIWNFWNSPMGDSLKNLITYSQIGLATICILGWWFLFAPVSRRTTLLLGLPVVILIVAWIGSIRSFDLSGDMVLTLHYRWEPKADENLAAHLASLEKPSVEKLSAREVPIVQPEDMPAYRGIHRDGVVIGPPLNRDWKANVPSELWRHPVGGGYSSMAIVGDLLVTLEQRGDDESVVCYEASTGRELWEHDYPADFFEAMGGAGPRATPTIHSDAVYSLGAFGDLVCLDLLTGELRWHVNALQQFHVGNTVWGMSSSPLIHNDHVIINIGGPAGNGLIAYDLSSGNVVWKSAGLGTPLASSTHFKTGSAALPDDVTKKSVPGYSSPQISTVAGEEVVLNFDGTGLHANDPSNGTELWAFPFKNGDHVNVAQPEVFEDGRIFLSASYGGGAKMLQVSRKDDKWTVEELWGNRNMRCKFTSPVLVDNELYGLDEGILVCIDPKDGKRNWKGGRTGLRGRYGHGQILTTNGLIFALTENGEAVLIDPNPEALTELTSMRVLPEGKNWNPPVLCRGKLYVRNAAEMACYDLRAPESSP